MKIQEMRKSCVVLKTQSVAHSTVCTTNPSIAKKEVA